MSCAVAKHKLPPRQPYNYGLTQMMVGIAAIPEGMKQMSRFCAHVRLGREVPRELLEHFATAFEQIGEAVAAGKPAASAAASALGIATKRGHQPALGPSKKNAEIELAAAVWIERWKKPRRNIPQCCYEVARLYGFPERESYVQDCYERWRAQGRAYAQYTKASSEGDCRDGSDSNRQALLKMMESLLKSEAQGVLSRPKNLPSK